MRQEYKISLHELVLSLSHALDLVDSTMSHHHMRVAYTALRLAESLGLGGKRKEDIVLAAALHDIGALSNRERTNLLSYDTGLRHAHFGYQLLLKSKPFHEAGKIIRFHHVPWEGGLGRQVNGEPVPAASHIVHLADRVDAFLSGEGSILKQGQEVCRRIAGLRGSTFVPEHVDALLKIAKTESFWLDLSSPNLHEILIARTPFSTVEMDLDGLLDFAWLLAQVIDFRSRYTATHSSGVAHCAATLAELIGFSESDCKQIQVAGFLHDIGKLAVPLELLEQKEKLSEEDRLIIRTHSYYSYRVLSPIRGLEDIAAWCGLHHERLTGGGYPFGLQHADIPLEARIIAVADVFTAVTEDRPYRAGMSHKQVLSILDDMTLQGALDARVVDVLRRNYDAVDRCRIAAQREAVNEYRSFMAGLAGLELAGARSAHLAWQGRLRGYLDGKLDLERTQVASHHECLLGQWYWAEGLTYYGHIPEMQELEAPHEALHHLMDELVQHREQGRFEKAEARYADMAPLSERIVSLLNTIERKAAEDIDASARLVPH